MDRDALEYVFNAGRQAAAREVSLPDGTRLIPVLDGVRYHEIPESRPEYIAQTVVLRDEESFVRYVNRNKTAGRSVVFVEVSSGSLAGDRARAVLDYHLASAAAAAAAAAAVGEDQLQGQLPTDQLPGRCRHNVEYTFDTDVRWDAWIGSRGKFMNQGDFAEFLEDRAIDIVEPSGASVLEFVKELNVERKLNVKGKTNLSNGMTQLTCVVEDSLTGSSGAVLVIPRILVIQIPVFKNGPSVKIAAKLSYSMATEGQDKTLKFRYTLVDPESAHDLAVAAMVKKLAEMTPDVEYFTGSAR